MKRTLGKTGRIIGRDYKTVKRLKEESNLKVGISIKKTIGIGDALQYSSVPENYFKATGRFLIDISRPWFFDHSPFVIRSAEIPDKTIEMWNFSPNQWEWPKPRPESSPQVYLSNAEIGAAVLGVPVILNRPRLYRFEDFPFEHRQMILFQTSGKSHGQMPDHIIDHVISKYRPTGQLYHIGPDHKESYGIPHIETPSLWDLAFTISKARMVIALDSGPAWVAACYPDVICKKVRTKPTIDVFKSWVPLEIRNIHSHWDDRCHMIYNVSDDDVGFTTSYRKI